MQNRNACKPCRSDDIVEGKKSLPVLLHIEENPDDSKIISGYFEEARKNGIESPAVEECIRLLESKGAISKACGLGKRCIKENSFALANLFGSADKTEGAKLILNLFEDMVPNA